MFPDDLLLKHIEPLIAGDKERIPLRVMREVSGGSINNCYQLKSGGRLFFLKVNDHQRFPGMFDAEKRGLELLGKYGAPVPAVVTSGSFSTRQFLLMEWIAPGAGNHLSQAALGRELAALHGHAGIQFGLDHHNYMGSLAQRNDQGSSFTDFFVTCRLLPQVKLAADQRLLDSSLVKRFGQLCTAFHGLYPHEKPALVHGDFWGGNYLIADGGKPVLIDPAVAWSHRETDLAMTRLFGGFTEAFYASYIELFPLAAGWQSRIPLWNLYPLLIHLNLFGTGYLGQVKAALARFV
ncbi:fructosamine kinase family protein [Hufsiella ginkgonis]|uniref:Phosphotransferase n=1 Tax=Hufsiella ginkgonis TaxID=2695274 RepID=A0A7K1XY46_9SPHI|nr:fructosamine kinase family protein [Hufsiella ginkgonis]MXV15669.1 phosphotransferase [Hufsiella ginkgonis]